jgi:hypothetical protein
MMHDAWHPFFGDFMTLFKKYNRVTDVSPLAAVSILK